MTNHLRDVFGAEYIIGDSKNKALNAMVDEIHRIVGADRPVEFYPPLKTDIAIGIKSPGGKVSMLLLEVKLASTLTLMHYSQLTGYLQVAKHIQVGLLLLVNKGVGASALSADFKRLIDISQLNFSWSMTSSEPTETNRFRTGICMFTPGNGIEWISSSHCGGISSWESLRDALTRE